MLNYEVFKNYEQLATYCSVEKLINFLFNHLGEFGDTKTAIKKSIDYAFSDSSEKGGFVLVAKNDNEVIGVLVMNYTGMEEYIPENILVYIAVHSAYRGKGYGGQIIDKAKTLCKGSIKLHVEYENPAKKLYERLGFTSKYAEMRFNRE